MKKFRLSRRHMLRGAIGGSVVALALPTLDVMLNNNGTALANGQELPRRLITWFFGNGVARNDTNNLGAGLRFTPSTQGEGWQINENLQPLLDKGVKDYCNILTGFRVHAAGPRGHHNGVSGLFSGYEFIELPANGAPYASKFGGPSIDQVAAQREAADTGLIPSIQLRVSKRVITGEGPTLEYLSHKSPDEPMSPVQNPQELWDNLFASFTPPDEQDPEAPNRLAALDAVMEDAKALQTRVSSEDRIRLEAHLDNVAQLQSQIDAVAPVCAEPEMPIITDADVDGQEQLRQIHDVMSELVAFAFSCDITRVASIQFTGSVGYTRFNEVGLNDGHHDLSHWTPYNGNAELCNEDIHKATTYTVDQFATLLATLRGFQEGDCNLLDQSVILFGSDLADGPNHTVTDMPVIVAGGGGGALKTPSVHYRSPNEENTSHILMSVLQAFDPTATEVGAAAGYSTTPVSAIMS